MLFSLSLLIAWFVTRLRASRGRAALPESRTDGSGNPYGGTSPPRDHSH
jgi:hypothetical protein